MPTHVYFVRHGRTENEDHITYGRMPGYPLSQEGQSESNKVGEILSDKNITQIYTSPLERTFETAEIIAKHCGSVKIKHVFDLNETESTHWQGMPSDELFTNNAYEAFINDPNAQIGTENLNQIVARMSKVLGEILTQNKGQAVVCVSHEFPILALKFKLEGKPLTGIKTIHLATGGILDFVFDDQGNFVAAKEVST